MNHYVALSLADRKSSVHLNALYSPRTALRMYTPNRDQLVICGQYSDLVYGYCVCPILRINPLPYSTLTSTEGPLLEVEPSLL
jgi:hypothetical protein